MTSTRKSIPSDIWCCWLVACCSAGWLDHVPINNIYIVPTNPERWCERNYSFCVAAKPGNLTTSAFYSSMVYSQHRRVSCFYLSFYSTTLNYFPTTINFTLNCKNQKNLYHSHGSALNPMKLNMTCR